MTKTDRNNSNLEKKLGAYALAGAALLAAPAAAKAEIQYVAVNQTFTSADATPNYDAAVTNDFGFFITAQANDDSGGGNVILAIATVAGGGFLTDGAGVAAALAFGAAIDPTDSANFGKEAGLTASAPGAGPSLDWSTTGGDAYLGFYFTDADLGVHSGWAHLATTTNDDVSSFEMIDYAYETDPNTVITAGQTEETAAAPEPSSLALLALGGAGLLAYRHRRSARFIQ